MGITTPTMEKTLSSQQATNWREGRRLRDLELKERGWKQTEIADALGVSEGAVSQWMKRAREEGVEALRHKPPPGAPSRLSEDQRAKLPELLAGGAQAPRPALMRSSSTMRSSCSIVSPGSGSPNALRSIPSRRSSSRLCSRRVNSCHLMLREEGLLPSRSARASPAVDPHLARCAGRPRSVRSLGSA